MMTEWSGRDRKRLLLVMAIVIAVSAPDITTAQVPATSAPMFEEASGMRYILPNGLRSPGTSMSALAAMLTRPVGRPIVDKTGITGIYDIKLSFAPEGSTDSPFPSIFTALQEQLGLKLEPQKVPVEMLVIDHLDEVPSRKCESGNK